MRKVTHVKKILRRFWSLRKSWTTVSERKKPYKFEQATR